MGGWTSLHITLHWLCFHSPLSQKLCVVGRVLPSRPHFPDCWSSRLQHICKPLTHRQIYISRSSSSTHRQIIVSGKGTHSSPFKIMSFKFCLLILFVYSKSTLFPWVTAKTICQPALTWISLPASQLHHHFQHLLVRLLEPCFFTLQIPSILLKGSFLTTQWDAIPHGLLSETTSFIQWRLIKHNRVTRWCWGWWQVYKVHDCHLVIC